MEIVWDTASHHMIYLLIWECLGPPNNFGYLHIFHFKILYLFQYWGGGERKLQYI